MLKISQFAGVTRIDSARTIARLAYYWTTAYLVDGMLIDCFQVIYTPGHSPDHICLFEHKHGWLFTGDLFVGGMDRALRVDYDVDRVHHPRAFHKTQLGGILSYL